MVLVRSQPSNQPSAEMQSPPIPMPKPSMSSPSAPTPLAKRTNSGGAREMGGNANKGEKEKTGRQSFSCAECRRLKLKCSREWPCTSCVKRGCAQICPNGEMRTGKGKRLILADTEELHQRISILEVALAQAHAKHSSTSHPLLASPYLFAPRDTPASRGPRSSAKATIKEEDSDDMAQDDDLVEGAFGTLTIGEQGQAKFVGSFAGSEYLRDGDDSDEDFSPSDETHNRTSRAAATINASLATPPATAAANWTHSRQNSQYTAVEADAALGIRDPLFGGDQGEIDLELMRAELPDYDTEGRALVESYWDNVNWQYQPIPRLMFAGDHILNAYDSESEPNAHKLACVFFVMAIGTMFDLNRPPFHPRAEHFFMLGRTCITAVGLEQASPATVQALHLMGTYILNDKRGNGAEVFWPILGTAVKVAQSLGLHRDGSHFGLSQYEIEERRQVWWEIVTYDRLQSLCFGRPCATSNKWSDTKMPEPTELVQDDDGFHRSKYKLLHLMERVIDVQTQTHAVSHAAVMQLDTELRDLRKNLPEQLLPGVLVQDLPLESHIPPHVVIHRLGIRLQIAQMRLLLNRPLFARALNDRPDDPSRSKLGPSFVALFESAQDIVQLVKTLVIYHPSLVARWWFFWFHAFSSAVCLAAIVIRAPTCAFASPAFQGMSIVCDISAAAREGCRAKKGLPILLRLRKRAHEALVAASRSKDSSATESVGEEDDLTHLAGSAKLRRVAAPLHKRTGSSPTTGLSGMVGTQMHGHAGENNTPSPNSGVSVATSATLAERNMYDGIVPAFPRSNDQGMPSSNAPQLYPHQVAPPDPSRNASQIQTTHQTPQSWLGDDGMGQYLNSLSPSSAGGSQSWQQNLASISPHQSAARLASGPGAGGAHDYADGQTGAGMDMDMSMALGIGRAMGLGMGMGMGMGIGYQANDGGLVGDVGMGQGNSENTLISDNDPFGFDFEAFVNQMGGA